MSAAPAPQFTGASTADDIIKAYGANAQGKVVIITGSNTGIGFESARALASAGAKVFAAARTQAKSAETVAKLKTVLKNDAADVHPLELELGSFASVRAAAATFLALNLPLHVLLLNAGIMANPETYTTDGIESQFGINHVAHFLLTSLLYDKLKASAPARVVVVSSIAQYVCGNSGILFDDLGVDGKVRSYNRWERYGNAKLANVLFAKELQKHFDADGADVTCVSLHPGSIMETELTRQPGQFGLEVLSYIPRAIFAMIREPYGQKTIPQGAATSVYCSLAPGIVKGEYYNNSTIPTVNRISFIEDAEMAKKLWQVTEEVIASKSK